MCKSLLEDNFQTLYNNTVSKFSTNRKNSSQRVQLTTTMFIPSVDNNSLEVRAKTKTDNAAYDSIIYLEAVEYVEAETPNSTSFVGPDGSEYFIMPVPRSNNVKVNCTCLDFYYSFAVWNDNKNSLFGDSPDPYVKKTKREPKNPTKSPGMCKHLLKFFDYLVREKIIK
jgi:hypothetical protein